MRKMFQMQMPGIDPATQAIFNEIFRASQEADVVDIGNGFTVSTSFTELRTFDPATVTTAQLARVVATLIKDLQRGGATKAT